jgi:ribosomal protein S7
MVRSFKKNKKKSLSSLGYFRIMNRFIRNGNKDFVYRCFLLATFAVKKKTGMSFNNIASLVFKYLRPLVKLKPHFSSGIIYQLPSSVDSRKELTMAVYWFYKAVQNRSERGLSNRIRAELLDLHKGQSPSIQLKIEYYKLIMANRVYLYRFKRKLRF